MVAPQFRWLERLTAPQTRNALEEAFPGQFTNYQKRRIQRLIHAVLNRDCVEYEEVAGTLSTRGLVDSNNLYDRVATDLYTAHIYPHIYARWHSEITSAMNAAPDLTDRNSTLNIGADLTNHDTMADENRIPDDYQLPPPNSSLRRQVLVQAHENAGYGGHPTPPPSPGRHAKVGSPPRVSRSPYRPDTPLASERRYSRRDDYLPPDRHTPHRNVMPSTEPLVYDDGRGPTSTRADSEPPAQGRLRCDEFDPLRASTAHGPRTRDYRIQNDNPLISESRFNTVHSSFIEGSMSVGEAQFEETRPAPPNDPNPGNLGNGRSPPAVPLDQHNAADWQQIPQQGPPPPPRRQPDEDIQYQEEPRSHSSLPSEEHLRRPPDARGRTSRTEYPEGNSRYRDRYGYRTSNDRANSQWNSYRSNEQPSRRYAREPAAGNDPRVNFDPRTANPQVDPSVAGRMPNHQPDPSRQNPSRNSRRPSPMFRLNQFRTLPLDPRIRTHSNPGQSRPPSPDDYYNRRHDGTYSRNHPVNPDSRDMDPGRDRHSGYDHDNSRNRRSRRKHQRSTSTDSSSSTSSSSSTDSDESKRRRRRKRNSRKERRRHRDSSGTSRRHKKNKCKSSSSESSTESDTPSKVSRLIPKMRPYDGKSDWQSFKYQYTVLSKREKWNSKEKKENLFNFLSDRALTYAIWHDHCSYKTLIKKLEARYDNKLDADTAQAEYQQMRQGDTESLGDFYDRVIEKAKEAFPEQRISKLQKSMVTTYLKGLRDLNAAWQIKQNKKPDKIHEAYTYAKDYIASRASFTSGRERSNRNPRESNSREMEDLRVRVNDLMSSDSDASGSSPRRGKCWTCGETGHYSPQCTKKRNSSPTRLANSPKGMKCSNCSSSDHNTKDCPVPSKCDGCQQTGHLRRQCPNMPCVRCLMTGHAVDSCTNAVRCSSCFELGHIQKNCTTVCSKCGLNGHKSQECKRLSNTNATNDKNRSSSPGPTDRNPSHDNNNA